MANSYNILCTFPLPRCNNRLKWICTNSICCTSISLAKKVYIHSSFIQWVSSPNPFQMSCFNIANLDGNISSLFCTAFRQTKVYLLALASSLVPSIKISLNVKVSCLLIASINCENRLSNISSVQRAKKR